MQIPDELFEKAPQAVALTTPDGRIIRVNEAFTRVFGFAPQAAIARRIGELIVPPESREEYRRQLELVVRGERVDAAVVLSRQDGSRFPVAMSLVPFSPPGQDSVVYAIYRDIPERPPAAEALVAGDERWRTIFDHSGVGIAVTDPQGGFVAANRAYREMLGIRKKSFGPSPSWTLPGRKTARLPP